MTAKYTPLAGPDVADAARPFLVRPDRTEVAIQQARSNVEPVIAVGCCLELTRSFNGDPVLAHQVTDAPVPGIDTNCLQHLCHSRPALAAQAQTSLLRYIRQNNYIRGLPPAGRATVESPPAARADVLNLTQMRDWEGPALFFNELKFHGFWLTKNWVAFLRCPPPP